MAEGVDGMLRVQTRPPRNPAYCHSLGWPRHGQGGGDLPDQRAANLGRANPPQCAYNARRTAAGSLSIT